LNIFLKGKSTLLKVIGGMHMLFPMDSCLVLGREAFGDRKLNAIRVLMQTEWAMHSVAFAGYNVPLQGDFPVGDMNKEWQEMYPERRAELIELLQLDLSWRMNRVSDGQRRRVQLFLHLLRPFEVLLLDEVLSVLDVVVRQDVLQYLKKECIERNATVIYATHIFDGLYDWPSDMGKFFVSFSRRLTFIFVQCMSREVARLLMPDLLEQSIFLTSKRSWKDMRLHLF
jgi:CCR4-NOT complex subunit CAF16